MIHFKFKASGAAAARILLGGSSPFQSRRTCFPFLLRQLVQGEPFLPCSRREAAASPTRRCRSVELFAGFCQQVLFQKKGASAVTSRSSASPPFNRHRLHGGKVAAALQDTSRLANSSRRKARANAEPPRRRRKSARFAPTAAISIVMSMSENQRSRGNPSAPETPSKRPPQISPECALPDLPAFVGI